MCVAVIWVCGHGCCGHVCCGRCVCVSPCVLVCVCVVVAYHFFVTRANLVCGNERLWCVLRQSRNGVRVVDTGNVPIPSVDVGGCVRVCVCVGVGVGVCGCVSVCVCVCV